MKSAGLPNLIDLSVGSWAFSTAHGESVRNHTVCHVWVPRKNTVERLAADILAPQEQPRKATLDRLVYAAAAARIADALTQDLLLAPLEAGVIPLPHQLYALSRAMSDDRIRYLLADEVGLGKTIEAGLVFRELKLRGLVKRVLVVAPKGIIAQWVQEMKTHFNEEFQAWVSQAWVSDLVLGLQPIMPLDLPVKVRSWELTVYPRSHIRRWFGVTRPAQARM